MVRTVADALAMADSLPPKSWHVLTALQVEVLILIVNGLTNQEIAARLATTPGQVGVQIGRIVQRLGLTSRAEIVDWALQQGCRGQGDNDW